MIDLHMHTTYSDGSYTISELLKEAQSKKISTISITDHNTISAYYELENNEIRSLYKGNIINGCELVTSYNGELIDVLAYNFNLQLMQKYLNGKYLTLEQKQLKEVDMIKERYKEIGVKFDFNNIVFEPKKELCHTAFLNEIKKYPQNNEFFLFEKSMLKPSDFTRNEVYNPKSPLYVNQSPLYPSLEKTILAIHEVGGLAFLAHTFAYSETIVSELENIVNNYKIDGLECCHTIFTKDQTQYLLQFCNYHNLFKSGGSDFHGQNKINHNMGTGDGSLNINEELIKEWYEKPQIIK